MDTAYHLEYYSQRVLDTVESWPADVLGDYARLVELLIELGPNLRLPFSRAMGDGLFELRPHGHSGSGRAMYCFILERRIVVLHAFLKKSRQTPEKELRLARKRLKEIRHGGYEI